MLRGTCTFKCDNCGEKFIGLDIECNAMIFSAPVKCPHCGSMHTRPRFSSKGVYEKIWECIDKQENDSDTIASD